jgi:hypothetical protein
MINQDMKEGTKIASTLHNLLETQESSIGNPPCEQQPCFIEAQCFNSCGDKKSMKSSIMKILTKSLPSSAEKKERDSILQDRRLTPPIDQSLRRLQSTLQGRISLWSRNHPSSPNETLDQSISGNEEMQQNYTNDVIGSLLEDWVATSERSLDGWKSKSEMSEEDPELSTFYNSWIA